MPARFPDSTVEQDKRQPIMKGENPRWNSEDDIVISGISGRLPESSNIEEFKQQLFDGVDLVTADDRRWPQGLHGLPFRSGKLKNLEYFDATFFGVHAKQANVMDPQLRMLLEVTYEAIIDAGVNPAEIRGSRTGVYIGVSTSEADEYWTSDVDYVNGYGLTGCCRAMFANRISYTFDFSGPSYSLDTACSSSLYGLANAIAAIKAGECDAAIVGGVNLTLKPNSSLQFHRLNMLSPHGMCKAFDDSGNGYVRSEAITAIFLQKSSSAKRVYATVIGAKTNVDGYKDNGITYPSGNMQNKLIRELYNEVGLDPSEISYIEAHGTGTKVGDPQEVNAIADAFCKNRKEPLLIGSVKSNMGHSEPASGLCSIAKVVIGMEAGVMPKNLHFKNPNPDIPALSDGRLKVVSENMPWKGGYVGVNSFGFGGANAHVILKSNSKPKVLQSVDTIPRLFTVSGRTEAAVNYYLDKLEPSLNDDELMALIHDIHQQNINGHIYRGYILNGDNPIREINEVPNEKRPVWFIYSGMGSQWSGMGKDLMKIDTFKNAINKCAYVLKPHGIDLDEIIMRAKDSSFDNILNSFVAIASVQIALTDVLTSLGIHPDGIIGHSVGEVGCAYADNTLTAEQTILAAFSRGKSLFESNVKKGSMAAIGLSWDECKKRCPSNIMLACHNSADNVTVSGPPEAIKKFTEELTAENVFARMVNSSGYAFHSRYIQDAGPKLRKALDVIIPNPKPRSSKWLSSSIPESGWNSLLAQYSSAAYHVNNLLSPVLFYETTKHIPENAIVIEIAPHGLLQAILKRTVGPKAINVSLMKRGHENNLEFFLSNLGKMFNNGLQPKIANLYPPITFPVGRGTPMLQSMIEWDHSVEWDYPDFSGKSSRGADTSVTIDLSKEEYSHISGHNIDGRVLFPATGYLTLVWKAFAKMQNECFDKLPVIFENVTFHRATIMPKSGPVKFNISILDNSGNFELCEGDSITVSGRIYKPEDVSKEMLNIPRQVDLKDPNVLNLNKSDVYKELRLRGYNYGGIFQGIYETNNCLNSGSLLWNNDWISFMDTMLQFSIVKSALRELYLPTRLQKAIINPKQLTDYLESLKDKENPLVPIDSYSDISIIKTIGIEIRGMKANVAPRRQQTQSAPTLEKYQFMPYEASSVLADDEDKAQLQSLTIIAQTMIENSANAYKLKIAEISDEKPAEALFASTLMKIMDIEPEIAVEYTLIAEKFTDMYKTLVDTLGVKVIQKDMTNSAMDQNLNLIVAHNLLTQNKLTVLENAINSLKIGGMVLLSEVVKTVDNKIMTKNDLKLICKQIVGSTTYFLLRKSVKISANNVVIQITDKNYNWLEDLKKAMKKSETDDTKVYLVVQNEENTGIMGLTTCLVREPGGVNVRTVFIQDERSEEFSLTSPFFVKQLQKDLVFNVLKNGVWGTFRHILLDKVTDNSALQVEHAYLNTLIRGDLASLRWIESPLGYYKNDDPHTELCSVYYAPLNFRDIMLASGKLPPDALPGNLVGQDCLLGLEFSGRDSKGRRVMGIVAARSMATTVVADKGFLWDVPSHWSLEEASTVPICYGTSYDALIVRGQMQPGESILIHAGSGGVGQAAITIALHMGCTVFTTVGTQAKRDFLKKRFPQLTDNHIGNSRDTSFEQLVLQQTNGRGVDLVLNSLAEDKLQASVRCLAQGGRFLEIGKVDFSNNNPLGMAVFLKNVSFHGILLDALTEFDSPEKKEMFRLLDEGIKNGVVRPLPVTVFSENQVEQAFRYIATGKHIGKVVLNIRNEENRSIQKPPTKLVSAIPRTYMDPDKCYVLVGGLGGLGLELANWFVTRGATKLVLTSRSGVKTGYQSLCIRRWKEKGVSVLISTANAVTELETKQLLEEANKLGPVGGIINLAGILRDAVIENLTVEDYKTVCLPKIEGTKNLDKLSRIMCPNLDYFIVFSSVSSGKGNTGQTNYGYANSTMERICESRQKAGLPGLAIQWGPIADVGMIVDLVGNNETEIRGSLPQTVISCLQTMDNFMQQPHPVLSSMVHIDKNRSGGDSSSVSLVNAIANILGVTNPSTIQPNVSLSDLGMDSIMGSEIKQTLERNYDLVLSAQEIRALTFAKLSELSNEGSISTATPPKDSTDTDQLIEFDYNELIPTKCIVKMQSKSTNNQKLPLIMIHPIEGTVSMLKNIVQDLDVPVYGLQCTEDVPLNSIEDLAEFYLQKIRSVQPKGPYTICGYSYGACIAFEIGVQLENANEKVKLVLLDGSPSYVTTQTGKRKSTVGDVNSEESNALAYFISQFKDVDQIKLVNELITIRDFKSKLSRTAEMLEKTLNVSADQIKTVAASFYFKLRAAEDYKPKQFNGEVVLLKSEDNFVKVEDDYGLTTLCKQKIKIQGFEGNHRSLLLPPTSQKIAEVIHNIINA